MYNRTSDFLSFSRSAPYFRPGFSCTDIHIFRATDQYVALYTAPDEHGLYMSSSPSLNPVRSSFDNHRSLFEKPRIITAPVVFESFDNNGWLLMGMENGKPRLFAAPTSKAADLEWWEFAATCPCLPANADGGKVLVITRNELSHLEQALLDTDGTKFKIQNSKWGWRSV